MICRLLARNTHAEPRTTKNARFPTQHDACILVPAQMMKNYAAAARTISQVRT